MAVTSRNLRTNGPTLWRGQRVIRMPRSAPRRPVRGYAAYIPAQPARDNSRLINIALWATVLLLLSLILGTVSGWIGTLVDDVRYGRPRVSHLSANVGHESANGLPTEFMAINLNRRVLILEFPGGDAAQARTIVGPYLFGAGEDLTPIKLDVGDINADNRPDLLVNIKNEQLVYINEQDAFRMITATEQQGLLQAQP